MVSYEVVSSGVQSAFTAKDVISRDGRQTHWKVVTYHKLVIQWKSYNKGSYNAGTTVCVIINIKG